MFQLAGAGDGDGVALQGGQQQPAPQQAAIGVGVGAHAALSAGREGLQVGPQAALAIKEFLGAVALQPGLQLLQLGRIALGVWQGDLVAAPEALEFVAIEFLWPGPAFRGAQHNHGPGRAADVGGITAAARFPLDLLDPVDGVVHGGGHGGVHRQRFAALHEQGLPAIAAQQAGQLRPGDAGQQGGIGDLVTVEVQHRQHGAVAGGIEEFVDVPAGGKGPRFRLAIADAGQGDQLRVVEHRSAGVGEHIAQLAPLVDRAGRFGGAVAADVAREGELPQEAAHADGVLGFVGIDLAVGAVQVGGGQYPRRAMARPREVDHAQVVGPDHPVGMGPDEGLARAGAPVAQQPVLDVLRPQRLPQQGVGLQVNHAHRQVVGGPPPAVEQLQLGRGHRCRHALCTNP